MLGLILYAEHSYCKEVADSWLEERCKFLTGLKVEEFMLMEALDLIPTVKNPNLDMLNPSKYLLYQDILLGAFDKHVEGLEVKKYYENLTVKYKEAANSSDKYKEIFEFYAELSNVLSIKASIGLDIRRSYMKDDKEQLRTILDTVIPELLLRVEDFHDAFRRVWFHSCKGHGFEVTDIRLGGVKERAKTSASRIRLYLDGDIDKIEELEDERLFFNKVDSDESKILSFNQYGRIATQNVLSW